MPVNVFCKINSFLKRKRTVCRENEQWAEKTLQCAEKTYSAQRKYAVRRENVQ